MNWFFNALSKHLAKEISKQGGDDGCYIATMVYGSYEHSSVLQLRRYRDTIMSESDFGRVLILIYYYISPKFVRRFSDKETLKVIIRAILDYFIER